MTSSGPLGGWDPLRPFDGPAAMWPPTAGMPTPPGTATVFRALFALVRRRLLGRAFTLRAGGTDITLTLTALDARLDALGLSMGQVDDVRLAGSDIEWRGHRIEQATLTLRNLHLRPAGVPALVAAPVELEATVDAGRFTDPVHARLRWLHCEVGPDAVVRLRPRGWPGLGHIEVEARSDGSHLWIRPVAVVRGRRRWQPGRRLPALPIGLPALPAGLHLTRVEAGPGVVHLFATLPVWREAMPTGRLEDLMAQLRSPTMWFDLTRGRGTG